VWDWREFVQLAATLQPTSVSNNNEIARARTTIGRAYYGAWHAAWEYALANGYAGPRSSDHAVVWNWLQGRPRTKDEKEAGNNGHRLMDMRRKADYKDPREGIPNPTASQAAAAVGLAQDICTLLPPPLPPATTSSPPSPAKPHSSGGSGGPVGPAKKP
jgi:hypothetical protein